MEGHMRDVCVLEEEVVYDQSQFSLLNSQIDDSAVSPALLNDPPRSKKPVNKWGKLARTAALCGAYISLGLCMSVTGPTLLYLKDQVGSTISEISYIFTVRSIGTLGGAFLGSILLDRCNPYSAFFVVIAMMAISVGSMPWCKHIWMLMVSSFVVGMGNGLLDTGASTLCLQLWGKDSGPYMQALHFSFAVGGSIAPLLVQAFIAESSTTALNNTSSSRHVRSATHPLNVSELEEEMTTMASIIKAISEPPVLQTSISPNSTTPTLNLNNPTNNSASENASTTASNSTVSQNQTTLTVDHPKKPKPAVINGQILGPSSQYDNVPLKIETPPPQEIVVATTTAASNESQTTITTTPSNTVVVSNDTAGAQNSSVIEIPTTILEQPKETEELNGNRSLSNTTTGSLESESKVTGNISTLIIPNTTTAASTVTSIPAFTVTKASNLDATGESQHDKLLFGNMTIDADETTFPATTTTSPTTGISITSSTPLPTATVSSSTETTSSFPTVVQSVPIENVTLPIPVATTLPVDPAEASIVKSRGKYRGQQDGVSLAVPSPAVVANEPDAIITSTTTTPAVSESDVIIDRAPTKVADYLERFGPSFSSSFCVPAPAALPLNVKRLIARLRPSDRLPSDPSWF
ncbi:Sodium-dependent glucose transporter 1 [Daphnia sinensis]|uniref:Sodium-dependent glucose transporter 1 n=1 Tax=Daphnia sinensis TaxID=1820382 RepID=A0AAD5Q052_9CRUS|nr:Sodium-dependent glucose transporter 1 [Daphnia sinensis]